MERLIYKCDPANLAELHCIHLKVMNKGNKYCCHRTKNGYCARFTELQIKDVVDKLGQLEEYGCAKMTELQKLKQLLDELQIDYESIGQKTVVLNTKPLFINDCPDGLYLIGWGYSGTWPYSAEFVARMLDRKFQEEMGGAV